MRIVFAVFVFIFAFAGAADTVIPVGAFQSVELSNGGHVIVRHGAVQRVAVIEGEPRCARVRVDEGRLVIDRSHRQCPGRNRVRIEVVTPHLDRVAVSNGGSIETVGAFPAQAAIEAAVEQGGTVDIRTIPVDDVDATVYSGGRIFTTSRKALTASVESGGNITYWGEVTNVKKSVRDGGVVTRGD